MSRNADGGLPESDHYPGAPHPRFAQGLIGHSAAEDELLDAYRAQKLAHAWLIGGPRGDRQGDARLALCAFHPRPSRSDRGARARRRRSQRRSRGAGRAPALALAHPDLVALRRSWNPQSKNFYSEIRVEDVRAALDLFHKSAGRAAGVFASSTAPRTSIAPAPTPCSR